MNIKASIKVLFTFQMAYLTHRSSLSKDVAFFCCSLEVAILLFDQFQVAF